jgi:hypothetical protein
MRRSSLAASALILASVPAFDGAAAQEQEEDPQSVLTATIAERFEYNSNYQLDDPSPGDTYFADTTFAVDYVKDTASQQLGLGFDVGLRALWEAEEDFDFVAASPTGTYLLFLNEGPHLAFDANLEFRSREVNEGDLTDPGFEGLPDDLSQVGQDSREYRYDADVGVVIAPEAPSSLELRFIGSKIDYSNAGGNQQPRQTGEGQATWAFRLNPVLSAAIFGDYLHYSADNNAETEVRVAEADAGFIYEPSDVLEMQVGVGYADRERKDFGDVTQSDSGPSLRGEITYLLPSFTVAGDARITTAAPETRYSFNLRSTYALARSRLIGRIFNRYTGTSNGNTEAQVTGAAIGIEHDLNTVSRVALDLSYAHQKNLDNDDIEDIDRANLTASYLYDLTSTVTAEIGYGYRSRVQDPEDADSHSIFVSIGRTFQTGL